MSKPFDGYKRGSSNQRGYNARWQRARAIYLREHPLCALCKRMGRLTTSTVVDHIKPHQGDEGLFWDEANWQALCGECHNAKTRAEVAERKGQKVKPKGCNANGMPTDPGHPWNQMSND